MSEKKFEEKILKCGLLVINIIEFAVAIVTCSEILSGQSAVTIFFYLILFALVSTLSRNSAFKVPSLSRFHRILDPTIDKASSLIILASVCIATGFRYIGIAVAVLAMELLFIGVNVYAWVKDFLLEPTEAGRICRYILIAICLFIYLRLMICVIALTATFLFFSEEVIINYFSQIKSHHKNPD